MTHRVLTLRLTRRAIGAAAIVGTEMTLLDGRFLNSRPEHTLPSAVRYLGKLIEQVNPTVLAIDSPHSDGSTLASQIRREAERLAADRGIPVLALDRSDILESFGVTKVRDRRELRDLMRILWPRVAELTWEVKPYAADAAAAALYAECDAELPVGKP